MHISNTQSFLLYPLPTVHFGSGKINILPQLCKQFGLNCLIIHGENSFIHTKMWSSLKRLLKQDKLNIYTATISGEPSPSAVDAIVHLHKNKDIDVVISIGGGSVLDGGKAVAAMLEEGGEVTDFLEGVGTKEPTGSTLPFIAIPTTSGTGSEATANAVLTEPGRNGFKKSLRHQNFVPDIAIIDPELSISCPVELTVSCGMDCFSQLVEGYLSTNSSPFTDSLAIGAIEKICKAIQTCFTNPDDINARSDMSYGAFTSGVVLANAGLGVIHGCAPILGSRYNIPHGAACGMLMAAANEATLSKLRDTKNTQALLKYTQLGKLVSDSEFSSNKEYQDYFIDFLQTITNRFQLPKLSSYKIASSDIPTIANNSANKYNPVSLEQEEIEFLLHQCL